MDADERECEERRIRKWRRRAKENRIIRENGLLSSANALVLAMQNINKKQTPLSLVDIYFIW
jgi:hypothetical protein